MATLPARLIIRAIFEPGIYNLANDFADPVCTVEFRISSA
jgi:hypothetical protein